MSAIGIINEVIGSFHVTHEEYPYDDVYLSGYSDNIASSEDQLPSSIEDDDGEDPVIPNSNNYFVESDEMEDVDSEHDEEPILNEKFEEIQDKLDQMKSNASIDQTKLDNLPLINLPLTQNDEGFSSRNTMIVNLDEVKDERKMEDNEDIYDGKVKKSDLFDIVIENKEEKSCKRIRNIVGVKGENFIIGQDDRPRFGIVGIETIRGKIDVIPADASKVRNMGDVIAVRGGNMLINSGNRASNNMRKRPDVVSNDAFIKSCSFKPFPLSKRNMKYHGISGGGNYNNIGDARKGFDSLQINGLPQGCPLSSSTFGTMIKIKTGDVKMEGLEIEGKFFKYFGEVQDQLEVILDGLKHGKTLSGVHINGNTISHIRIRSVNGYPSEINYIVLEVVMTQVKVGVVRVDGLYNNPGLAEDRELIGVMCTSHTTKVYGISDADKFDSALIHQQLQSKFDVLGYISAAKGDDIIGLRTVTPAYPTGCRFSISSPEIKVPEVYPGICEDIHVDSLWRSTYVENKWMEICYYLLKIFVYYIHTRDRIYIKGLCTGFQGGRVETTVIPKIINAIKGIVFGDNIDMVIGTDMISIEFVKHTDASCLTCYHCGGDVERWEKFACKGCGVPTYCSWKCKKKDWLIHRAKCISYALRMTDTSDKERFHRGF